MQVYFLIDRSGSMASRWDETIGAVNGYVAKLKEDGVEKIKTTVSFFDSNEPFKVIRERKPLNEWNDIDKNEITPRGMTPLYDAVSSLYEKVREKHSKKATVIIVTDGAENASSSSNKEKAKRQLDELRAKNYDVVFIGADFDAFGDALSLGSGVGSVLNASAGNYNAAFNRLATRGMAYAASGEVASFTDEDRKIAVGE